MLSSPRAPALDPNRDPVLWGNSSSRPFLPSTQAALPERQRLPDRSSHSSLGARGRADVIAQGGHVPLSLRGRGASRKSRGPPLLFCQACGSWMVSPGLPSGRGWVWRPWGRA